ncbi:MAG TPA: PAS domain S-box protein [Candidatus Acidoferrales bacterium]|nr:PAS domain S-box protein [Candidatus Acidoferrales bacterium]
MTRSSATATMPETFNIAARPARANFQKVERREWWLWGSAALVTLLLTAAVVSFFLPDASLHHDVRSFAAVPEMIRGLVGLVFLFDLYVMYQHLQITRIRRQLIEREALFQLIGENAADMIAIVDMHGRRIYNSVSYQRVLGYTEEELRASLAFQQIHPDDRERVQRAAEEARVTGVGRTLEYRIRHKNGEWLTLESTSSVIRDPKGEPERLVIVNRNITERKRAEEALFQSEASFRSMMEDAPYGIYRATPEGKLLLVNPSLQKMLGYESGDGLLKTRLETDVFRNPGEYQRMKEALAAGNELKDVEWEWNRSDGTSITVRCSGHAARDPRSALAYFEIFVQDVTEKRVLERQLRMAQKMEAIGRLSGGIAHDFNNLLGVIIGYSGVLKKSLKPADPCYEHTVEIEKAGQRAASLTRQLLAFSRQQVLTPTVLNLNTLVADMQRMLPRLLGEDIHVSASLAPDLGSVKADQSQIEQTIMNLAVNSRDAMPAGGKLRIETSNVTLDAAYTRTHPGSRAGEYVLLTISDSGTGMDPETLTHIFEPFFTTKELGKGTGLGLATVYGVVKQSNGYIWVESTPGEGASFQIYLPRHAEEAAAPAELKPEAARKPAGAKHILLVEDAEALRKLAQALLEGNGFHVTPAASAEDALEIVATQPLKFDLLLTDVVMPGMNGHALAEHLSARHPGFKVLFMSGYSDSFMLGHGALRPGVNLLHKPFTEAVLLAKVHEALYGGGSAPNSHAAPPESTEVPFAPRRM